MDDLNPGQREAVLHDGHTTVVAPPGSGKTKTVVSKIALQLQNPTCRIAAVSFTRDSSAELHERVVKQCGDKANRVMFGTFHKHCIAMLKKSKMMPNILEPGRVWEFVSRAIQSAGLSLTTVEGQKILEEIKCDPDAPITTVEGERLFKSYQALLKQNKVVDLNDVVRLCVEGLESGSIAPLPVQYLHVDEFQDTDRVQLKWVLFHARAGIRTTVVGDDDQSIYGWRAALGFKGMQAFTDAVNARQVVLSENYRCREEILSRADQLIRFNTERVSKNIIAMRGKGGSIKLERFSSRDVEASRIAEFIEMDTDRTYRSWAVLARNNALLLKIAAELRFRGIPYDIKGSKSDLWDSIPLLQYRLLIEGIAHKRWRDIEAVLHAAGLTEPDLREIADYCGSDVERLTPQSLKAATYASPEAVKRGAIIARAVPGLRTQLEAGRVKMVLSNAADAIEVALSHQIKSGDIENLYYGRDLLADRVSGPLLSRIALIKRPKDDKQNGDAEVVLLSMHGAKGLEFDKVWLPAIEEGIMPSQSEAKFSPTDEERRLLYVAMTRAKNELYISTTITGAPSSFLVQSGLLKP